MTQPTIAIIGAGHLGKSLIGGLIKNGYPGEKLWATNPKEEKLAELNQHFHIHMTTDNKKAARAADVIILTVKPAKMAEVIKELAPIIHEHHPLIISCAAAIREESIQHWLDRKIAIVRAMPNTPALMGCSATALFSNAHTTEEQRNIAESILKAVGTTVWVNDEKLLDTITALSGSGPAYFFLMMEVLQDAAIEMGLPEETARLLTLQTALGAARMAIESDKTPAELRHQVTSPGGTTEKAVSVLEGNDIRGLFKSALEAGKWRAEELAKLLGEKK